MIIHEDEPGVGMPEDLEEIETVPIKPEDFEIMQLPSEVSHCNCSHSKYHYFQEEEKQTQYAD